MTTARYKIFFEDEAPRIGCGWRYVTAAIGRKWVRCRDAKGATARFTRAQFERLKPRALDSAPGLR